LQLRQNVFKHTNGTEKIHMSMQQVRIPSHYNVIAYIGI